MRRLAVTLLLLCVAGSARAATWLPIQEALTAARESGKLIVLYLSSGHKTDDDWVEEWVEGAGASVADHVVLARGTTASAVLLGVPSLHQYFSRSLRRGMLILDPDGNVILSPASAFGDFGVFTALVREINLRQPAFFFSARLLRDGKVTESLLAKGHGLLAAFVLGPADDAFAAATERARREHAADLEQFARLGHVRVEIERWQVNPRFYSPRGRTSIENQQEPGTAVLQILESITAHPASNSIGAQAWYLVGMVRMVMREGRAAGDAYKNAYRLAEKPSPMAEAAHRELDMLGVAVADETPPASGTVHLVLPRRAVMAGAVEIVAVAAGAARVEFFLDGARVTERTSAPFTASISLSTLPRTHTIKVVAFDASGRRLGEDAATVNDRKSSLSVRIVQPRGDTVESHALVELEPRVPDGIMLQSVDLYWNDKRLATMTAPPFRYELILPRKNASGYLRAVAHDANGAVAEDTKLINVGGVSDSARIDAVELYAIVQDQSGHTIEGLTAGDFEVKEDGQTVKVDLQGAVADPIAFGIAVDTSGSMRVSMAAVIDYVAEFVQTSLAEKDQTLLVAFDAQPHVLQPLTSDLRHIRSDLSAVEPSGQTAVWDSVIYALQQLRSAHGRRALLVFTDGNDNASRTDSAAAIQIAHETGVPVYVVLTYSEQGSAQSSVGFQHSTSLEQLANTTGGTVFRFPKRSDLPKLFAQVRDDTRGEYLLSYVSHSAKPSSELRKISITVPSKHAIVRAMSGYFVGSD
jgi:VWFA-related protein